MCSTTHIIAGQSEILTYKGYKKVNFFNKSEFLVYLNNVCVPIEELICISCIEKFVKIKFHCIPFLTLLPYNYLYVLSKNDKKATWQRACSLTGGHYVGIHINKKSCIPPRYLCCKDQKEIWYTIGAFIANGFVIESCEKDLHTDGEVFIGNVNKSKLKIISKYLPLERRCNMLFGCHNSKWYSLLQEFFSFDTRRTRIPTWALDLPLSILNNMINGYESCIYSNIERNDIYHNLQLIYIKLNRSDFMGRLYKKQSAHIFRHEDFAWFQLNCIAYKNKNIQIAKIQTPTISTTSDALILRNVCVKTIV